MKHPLIDINQRMVNQKLLYERSLELRKCITYPLYEASLRADEYFFKTLMLRKDLNKLEASDIQLILGKNNLGKNIVQYVMKNLIQE